MEETDYYLLIGTTHKDTTELIYPTYREGLEEPSLCCSHYSNDGEQFLFIPTKVKEDHNKKVKDYGDIDGSIVRTCGARYKSIIVTKVKKESKIGIIN